MTVAKVDTKSIPYSSDNSSFIKPSDKIAEGDLVIIHVSFGSTHPIIVKRGDTLTMKYGALRHDYIIDKPWGSRISATAGYVHALRPTCELWTRCLPRRTQILYTPDVSYILQLLDIKPGMVVCESGTGSGSLSHALALAVAPTGHLYTHDIDETRVTTINKEFKEHNLSEVTTAKVQNVCTDGFYVADNGECDAVFLDVPAPWEAISFTLSIMSRSKGGRLVSFSPCIEQVQRACEMMRQCGYVQIETVEINHRTHKVVSLRRQSLKEFDSQGDSAMLPDRRKRKLTEAEKDSNVEEHKMTAITYPYNQPTHTGYLTHATLLSRTE